MMSKSPSEAQLLQWIDEFSFAVNDLVLFLNSHPNNQQAMACLRENLKTEMKLWRNMPAVSLL
jgi:spore coat protein JB